MLLKGASGQIPNQNKMFANFLLLFHDDVIKWKLFPRYWPFVRGIHRSLVNSPHKDQWRRALMFSLICARIDGWVNNREAGDLRRHQAHCDVIVMFFTHFTEQCEHLGRDRYVSITEMVTACTETQDYGHCHCQWKDMITTFWKYLLTRFYFTNTIY